MPLHLLKLCVGVATIDDLEGHVEERLRSRRADEPAHAVHTTRMVPTRATEILDGGSLYWVIRGHVAARQLVRGIDPFTDAEGVGRCRLTLEADVVPVMPRFFVGSIAQSGGHPRRDVSGVVAPRTSHLDPAIRPVRQAMVRTEGRRVHVRNIRGTERWSRGQRPGVGPRVRHPPQLPRLHSLALDDRAACIVRNAHPTRRTTLPHAAVSLDL